MVAIAGQLLWYYLVSEYDTTWYQNMIINSLSVIWFKFSKNNTTVLRQRKTHNTTDLNSVSGHVWQLTFFISLRTFRKHGDEAMQMMMMDEFPDRKCGKSRDFSGSNISCSFIWTVFFTKSFCKVLKYIYVFKWHCIMVKHKHLCKFWVLLFSFRILTVQISFR